MLIAFDGTESVITGVEHLRKVTAGVGTMPPAMSGDQWVYRKMLPRMPGGFKLAWQGVVSTIFKQEPGVSRCDLLSIVDDPREGGGKNRRSSTSASQHSAFLA